jgi:hypothetical protein
VSGRAFGGSCRWWSSGIAIGQGAQSNGASPLCTLARSNGGPWPGKQESERGCSSQVVGRDPGNRVPLYGHRNPRTHGSDTAPSRCARWRGPDRGCVADSGTGSRGDSSGSGGSRAPWPSFLLGIGAIDFCEASFSTVRPSSGIWGYSTWPGGDLEGGERSAFRKVSGGKRDRGHRASAGGLSPVPR